MEDTEKPLSLDTLSNFKLDRVLNESTQTSSLYLLGTIHGEQAIVHIERSVLPADAAHALVVNGLETLDIVLENKPYYSALALFLRSAEGPQIPDISLKLIWPATETHIRKYSRQERFMVRESPEIYGKVVVPYIESFPPSRIEWVYNILDGVKEADRVLHNDPDPQEGFMILPDLKWDQTTTSALYLTVLVRTRSIKSIRDLTAGHLPLLRKIRQAVFDVTRTKFSVNANQLRLFVHYQPSYYHFHVHVTHIYHEGMAGMMVGQARLLDDLISLLELTPDLKTEGSILKRMTFTYPLGVEHGLYERFREAGALSIEDGGM